MRKKDGLPDNIFTGTWIIVCLECFVQERGWTLFKSYNNGEFVWQFTQTRRVCFPSGSVVYGGRLKERFKYSPQTETTFTYLPHDRHLYIDRTEYEPGELQNACINQRYRLEPIGAGEYWIYDLEDVWREPEDYRFRIKIRRRN